MRTKSFLFEYLSQHIISYNFSLYKTALVWAVLCIFFPFSVSADSTSNINATISSDGIIPAFSVSCATASSTGATQYFLRFDPHEPLYKSYGVIQRVPCVEGVATFAPVNIQQKFDMTFAGISYPDWFTYTSMPQALFVKDTTGLCDGLCNLYGAFNNYQLTSMLPEDTTWPTLGGGPVFTYDGTAWSNTANGSSTPPAPFGLSNVLFLPGLEASRLYVSKGGVTCRVNCEDQLWESNKKTDVEDLYLNPDGTSKKDGIYTRDAIKETNTPFATGFVGQNIYKTFFETLDSLTDISLPADKRMARWEAYAYDWRQSVDDIVENGTQYEGGKKSLIATLESLVASSTTGKVTIIAHSNGGLIAKALLVKLQAMKTAGVSDLIDHIDTLILVASPQIGTATAVPVLLHGYDQRIAGGLLMDEEHARELGRNMSGAYGLLPSKEYINRVDISPVTFTGSGLPGVVTTPFINAYGSTTDSYPEYKNFLLGQEGRVDPAATATKLPVKLSTPLLIKAESLHDSIDAWVPPTHLRVIQVAGWGVDTVASFNYVPKYSQTCTGTGLFSCYVLDEEPIFTVDGDKTVVEPSALYMGGERYWVDLEENNFLLNKDREHKDILEVISLNNLIKSVISKTDIVFDTVLKNTKPIDTKNRLRISIHSPVSIGSYDSSGNFTGKVCLDTEDFCYIQEDIPNSSYLEFGEGKYINLLEENMQKVVLQGTGTGTFTYVSEKVSPEGQTNTSTFTDIPVTTQTQGEVTINQTTQKPELKLDVNGDGTTDFTLAPAAEFDPIVFLQIMKKTVGSFDIKQSRKNTLIKRIDGIITSIQKGKISKAKLKVEKFKESLQERKESKEDKRKKEKKHRKLDSEEIEILVSMLEKLLDNLEK